jgi:hypothetical protein
LLVCRHRFTFLPWNDWVDGWSECF